MKKTTLWLIAVIGLVVATAVPGAAATYAEPDAGEHPYVGFAIYFVPSEPGWFSCSGTLLDADTFLTAGHCTSGIGYDGEEGPLSGGTDVWVTFQETDTLAGWPARGDYPDEESLYAARSAWLDASSTYSSGTAIPHPEYDDFASFPVTHDVGVIELDVPTGVSTYGQLADLGAAAALAGDTGRGRNDALVETVGYGVQSIQPKPLSEDSRYKATSRVIEVNGSQSTGGNLHTSNNPSSVGGRGGSCFGDSGGPVFVNDTNVVLAVVSYGPSATCHGADYSWRVDTTAARDFLLPLLDE